MSPERPADETLSVIPTQVGTEMATTDDERTVDERGRVTIPKEMRDALGIEAGEEVALELREGEVVIRPRVSREEFIETMEGCINEETVREDAEDIDPHELTELWTSDLPEE